MEKLIAYMQTSFFDLSEDEVHVLAQGMVAKELSQYQTLYRRAEPSNAFFIIDTGRVSLLDENAHSIFTATSANCLGEGEFFRQEPRPLTARAESNVAYWEMSTADFLQILAVHPRIGLRLGQQQETTIAQMADYLLDKLGQVSALSSLGPDILLSLARSFKPLELQAGDVLYRQNDAAQGLYLVDMGNLVRTDASVGQQPLQLPMLLGIDTLFRDSRYDHGMEATEDTLCWLLSRGDFTRLNTQYPVLQRALQSAPLQPRTAVPTSPAIVQLTEALRGIPALRSVPSQVLEETAARFTRRPIEAGEAVYGPGDTSDAFYLVLDGEIELSMSSATGVNQELSRVTPGPACLFGLSSLLADESRTKLATATVDTELGQLSRLHLNELCVQHPVLQDALRSHAAGAPAAVASTGASADLGDLSMFAVFAGLSGADLARFPAVLKPATFYPQEQIYARGDSLQYLYLLQQGTILLERQGQVEPEYLAPGSTLGVDSLMTDKPSQEHAFASSEVRVISLPRDMTMQLAREIPQFQENLLKLAMAAASPAAAPSRADSATTPADPAQPVANPYASGPASSRPPDSREVPPRVPPVPPPPSRGESAITPPPAPEPQPPGPIPPPVREDDPFLVPHNTSSTTHSFRQLSTGGKLRAILLIVLLIWLGLALLLSLVGATGSFLPLSLTN